MIAKDPGKPDGTSLSQTFELWRPDGTFEPKWFIVELVWEGRPMLPDEDFIRRKLLASALPLLRNPSVRFRPISAGQMLLVIDSPDAFVTIHISRQHMVLNIQVLEDAVAAVRFCEHVDGNCCSGLNRVRTMPDGNLGKFYPLDSGYLFGKVTQASESPYQTIAISDHPIYGRALVLDREIQVGELDEKLYSGTMVSHAYSTNAKRILILGGGDCGVLREILSRPVERVVMVEYDPEVVRFCQKYLPSIVGDALEDERVELRIEDAFKYLAECQEQFDLVLSDLPDTPIGNYDLHDQIDLMRNVLSENGTLGTHAEFNHLEGSYAAEPIIAAISKQFENVAVTSKVIPSFQDQIWLFVKATGSVTR